MNHSYLEEIFPKGEIITVTIEKVDHYGGYVDLKGGIVGFIPIKELSWSRSILDAHDRITKNEIIDVMILDYYDNNSNVLLSLKRTKKDPWYDFIERHEIGDIVVGEVLSILDDAAYVELENQIDGIIPLSLVWIKVERMEEALLVKDRVVSSIIGFDHLHHHVTLSITALFEKEFTTSKQSVVRLEDLHSDFFTKLRFSIEKQTSRKAELTTKAKSKIKKILIVDPDLRTRKSLRLLLESICNIFIQDYSSISEAIPLLNTEVVDLVFIDVNVKKISEISQLFYETQINYNVPLIIQIDPTERELADKILKKDGIKYTFLCKPWTYDILIELLNNIENPNFSNVNTLNYNETNSLFEKISDSDQKNDKQLLIKNILSSIRSFTSADLAVIFKLHLKTFESHVFEYVGNMKQLTDKENYLLRYSPVKDVIYNDVEIFDFDVSGRKYLHLQPIGKYQSIFGKKVDIMSEWGYGLFIFGKLPNQFSHASIEYFKNSLLILGTFIERQLLEEMYKSKHSLIIAGQLSSMLIHELNHEQQLLFHCFEILKNDSIALNSKRIEADDNFLSRFQKVTNTLISAQNNISNINDLFLSLVKSNKTEIIEVNEYIRTLIQTIRELARKENIDITFKKKELLKVSLNTNYLNQILINQLINSIEQISLIRSDSGRIDLDFEYDATKEYPLQIRISDNGPGIHEIYKDKIFDIFFTTKKGGSGLGLFISKSLVNSMNGQIIVEKTIRFGGTSFLIQIPANKI